MFSFNGISAGNNPIVPEVDGTPNIYLTKAVYEKPEGKTPRLELHLEQRKPGARAATQTLVINDYSINGPAYAEQPEQVMQQYLHLLMTYNPDKSQQELTAQIGNVDTLEEFTNRVIAMLPENYPVVETTWFLRYNKGKDILSLPKYPPFIKLGTQKFKSNPKYDFFTPQNAVSVPTNPIAFANTDNVFGSAVPVAATNPDDALPF